MVDCQLRPNKVSDSRGARRPCGRCRASVSCRRRWRRWPMPTRMCRLAGGRCLMEPMVLARLVQLADPRPGERVLVVGAGTGYGAAVLAACGASVVALEESRGPAAHRPRRGGGAGPRRAARGGPVGGWLAGGGPVRPGVHRGRVRAIACRHRRAGPRDRREAGRRARHGRAGSARPRWASGSGQAPAISLRPAFDCATPVLPGLEREPGFVF